MTMQQINNATHLIFDNCNMALRPEVSIPLIHMRHLIKSCKGYEVVGL